MSLPSDLDAMPGGRGVASLANFCLDVSEGAGGIGGADTALHRLESFFRAHVKIRPSTPADIPWKDRAALEASMRWYGPTCSPDDLATVLSSMNPGGTYAGVAIS